MHLTLHSSLNVISSAPHVHADVPVDGNAECVTAVSPFASYKGPPFASLPDNGFESYHSDEEDEGECVTSRSQSLQVQALALTQPRVGCAPVLVVMNTFREASAAWVLRC